MILFPAIDLYEKKAVRLYKGDYANMTVYSDNPIEIARDFENCGCTHIHMVDLEGAKDGTTPNLAIVAQVAKETSLFVEIGGGIRDMETVERYLDAGVSRVILGTAAVNDEAFLRAAVAKHGEKIAVGADVKDGKGDKRLHPYPRDAGYGGHTVRLADTYVCDRAEGAARRIGGRTPRGDRKAVRGFGDGVGGIFGLCHGKYPLPHGV